LLAEFTLLPPVLMFDTAKLKTLFGITIGYSLFLKYFKSFPERFKVFLN